MVTTPTTTPRPVTPMRRSSSSLPFKSVRPVQSEVISLAAAERISAAATSGFPRTTAMAVSSASAVTVQLRQGILPRNQLASKVFRPRHGEHPRGRSESILWFAALWHTGRCRQQSHLLSAQLTSRRATRRAITCRSHLPVRFDVPTQGSIRFDNKYPRNGRIIRLSGQSKAFCLRLVIGRRSASGSIRKASDVQHLRWRRAIARQRQSDNLHDTGPSSVGSGSVGQVAQKRQRRGILVD